MLRLISEVRAARSEVNVPPSVTTPLLVKDAAPESLARAGRWLDAIRRLGRVSEVTPLSGEPPRGVVQAVVGEATAMLPLAEVIDLGAERARLAKERGRAATEADKIAAKLGNADFVARARGGGGGEPRTPRRRARRGGAARRGPGAGGGVGRAGLRLPLEELFHGDGDARRVHFDPPGRHHPRSIPPSSRRAWWTTIRRSVRTTR